MGRLYSPDRIEEGRIPNGDGSDHSQAAKMLLDGVKDVDRPGEPMSGMAFGSVITGRANRRSDVDFLLRYSSLEQLIELQRIVEEVETNHHVNVEAQTFRHDALESPSSHDISPLFASHLLDVQDEYSRWVHGLPVEELRQFAIDTREKSPEDVEDILTDVISYVHYKMRQFAKTSLMRRSQHINYYTTQRALELPKALGRKAVTVTRMLGVEMPGKDVTDKAAMRDSFYALTETLDDDSSVEHYHYLDGLDASYDKHLEEAVKTGDTEAYTRWLGSNWLKACDAAHRLCEDFGDAMKEVAVDQGVVLEHATPQGSRV